MSKRLAVVNVLCCRGDTPPGAHNIADFEGENKGGAEAVGFEPTRPYSGHGLANHWNDRYPTPPASLIVLLIL